MNVLKVPTSALFREDAHWAVYAVRDGRAQRARVELGRQTGQDAEVTAGLAEGVLVVIHPPDTLTNNARVTERSVRTAR
jgi:HlyD family secretion protein